MVTRSSQRGSAFGGAFREEALQGFAQELGAFFVRPMPGIVDWLDLRLTQPLATRARDPRDGSRTSRDARADRTPNDRMKACASPSLRAVSTSASRPSAKSLPSWS